MRVCVSCKTRYQKGSGVTFHKFPTDSTQQLWLKNMNIGNWTPKPHDHLCSKHFVKDCFILHFTRTLLKKDSVPTIFSDKTLPDEKTGTRTELEHYDDQIHHLKSEELAMSSSTHDMDIPAPTVSEPRTICNKEWSGTPNRLRTVTEIQANVNHDHCYEFTLKKSSHEALKVALRHSRTRIKVLTQHVKRLKTNVSSLKMVIHFLKQEINDQPRQIKRKRQNKIIKKCANYAFIKMTH